MNTQQHTEKILPKLMILFIVLAGMEATPQSTIPEFTILNSCIVSNSTGYHDGNGWVDIDNDGDLDLIITNSANNNKPNLLYRNERGDLFTQIKNTEYTMQKVTYGLSGPFGDIDNDGDEDVVLVDWEGTNLWIYKNDGYGNFTAGANIKKRYDGMVVLLDINKDSYLDLVEMFAGESRIYYNDGDGNYADYEILNIERPNPTSVLFVSAFGDADNDGDFDMYLGNILSTNDNLHERNLFYLNNGSGSFVKEPDTSVIVSDMAITMGVNWVDYDNDGDMDLYVLESTVYGPPDDFTGVLYKNNGDMVFEKCIIEPIEYCNTHKISPVWGDLDNDGDQELLISVEKTSFGGHTTDLKHNILFQNNGDGSFTEVTEGSLVEISSHTATMEDFDNDGDLDVVSVGFGWASNGKNYLCENQGNDNSWFVLTCEGKQSGKTPFGTRVQTIANINGKRVIQTREITPTTGHNTTYPSSRLHFGLGDADLLDTLIVKWPLGHVDIFTNVKAGQFYRAIEDSVIELDFRATSYIRQKAILIDTAVGESENLTFNLTDYYELITGDTVPALADETLSFSLFDNENAYAVNASMEGNLLSITSGSEAGTSTVQILTSAGFTERVDGFMVEYKRPTAARQESSLQLRIYPNPVTDRLFVEFEKSVNLKTIIQLTDITGKVVYSETLDHYGSRQAVNLTDLAKGIYFLKVCTGENAVVKKVIKN